MLCSYLSNSPSRNTSIHQCWHAGDHYIVIFDQQQTDAPSSPLGPNKYRFKISNHTKNRCRSPQLQDVFETVALVGCHIPQGEHLLLDVGSKHTLFVLVGLLFLYNQMHLLLVLKGYLHVSSVPLQQPKIEPNTSGHPY